MVRRPRYKGPKNAIHCMLQKLRPFTRSEVRRFGRKLNNRRLDRIAKPFIGKLWNIRINGKRYIKVSDIDTPHKLARMIRINYGFGTFNVFFWNNHSINSKFKYAFTCKKRRCPYYRKCRRKNVHKNGESCMRNPKHKPSWSKRAKIVIRPVEGKEFGKDFTFNFKRNSMRYMFFWNKSYRKKVL